MLFHIRATPLNLPGDADGLKGWKSGANQVQPASEPNTIGITLDNRQQSPDNGEKQHASGKKVT